MWWAVQHGITERTPKLEFLIIALPLKLGQAYLFESPLKNTFIFCPDFLTELLQRSDEKMDMKEQY